MPADLIPDHLMHFWGGSDAVFGAGPAAVPATANAIEHLSVDAPFPRRRVVGNAEFTGNRGNRKNGRGAYDAMAVKLLTHLRGGGAGNVPPKFGFLFKAAAFAESIGGSSVTYARSIDTAVAAWLWGCTKGGEIGVMYAGIADTEIGLPDVGTDNPRIEFTMQAARGATVYKTTVGTGGIDIDDTALPLAPGHGWVIAGAPAFIQVGDEVMRVTAVSGNTATVVRAASGAAAAHVAGDEVLAYVPERAVPANAPIGEVGGGFTIDDGSGATERSFVKAGLVVKTGVDLLDKPALGAYREGLALMKYGDDGVRLTGDVIYTVGDGEDDGGISYLHGHAESGASLAVVMTIGSEAGNKLTVTLPTAEVVDIAAPMTGDGPRKGTVIFGGYSTNGADVTLKFE